MIIQRLNFWLISLLRLSTTIVIVSYCFLPYFDLFQINRSHFTIKSVLTPLLLNKYARWLRFYLPTFTSICRSLIHLRSSLFYSKQSFKVLRQTFLTPLGFNRLRGDFVPLRLSLYQLGSSSYRSVYLGSLLIYANWLNVTSLVSIACQFHD